MPETTDTDVLENDAIGDVGDVTPDAPNTSGDSSAAGAASVPARTPPVADDSFLSIRDAAAEFGYQDAGQFQDDESLLRHMIERANGPRPDDQLTAAGRRYLQHAADFEDFIRQREQQQAAAPPSEEPKFWDPPTWNPNWLNQVRIDEQTGAYLPVNGGNPEIAQRVQQYVAYRQDQQEKFWSDPFSYMEPYLQHREQGIEKKIQEAIDQRLAAERSSMEARQFVDGNVDWIYELDAEGKPRFQMGAEGPVPVLTAEGQRFAGYVNDLSGLPQPLAQEYAMRMIELDRIKSGQASPDDGRQNANKRILQKTAQQTQQAVAEATPNVDAPPAGDDQVKPTFEQMLRAELKNNNVTDAQIEEQMLAGAV